MKNYPILLLILINIPWFGCAQIPEDRPHCKDEAFDKKVASTISFSIPTISVEEMKKKNDPVILDARALEEYEVSHIKGARHIGYSSINKQVLKSLDKNAEVIVYCSIGYRSEKVGMKLKKMGFTNVYNLFGSIFEWVNLENEVVDKAGQKTNEIHTYNKKWSKWVNNPAVQKVW